MPIGFPGCRLCAYRAGGSPAVCLACLGRSPGQAAHDAPGPRCGSCGQLRPPGSTCPTLGCARPARPWTAVFDVGVHDGGLRRAILRYKYAGERWWAGVFANLLAGWLDLHAEWLEGAEAVVPVPAYTGPGARRHWDPMALVAAALAERVGPLWPVEVGVLAKRRETPPMGRAGRRERQQVVASAWRRSLVVREPARVAGRRLVVLDDVLTEGSTAAAVAGALRHAGAAEVAVLVLARPAWRAGMPAAGAAGRSGRRRAGG